MYIPKESPASYYKLLHQKRVAELFLCALRFDLFSCLTEWETAHEVAAIRGLKERSVELVLNALAATGFLEKSSGKYRNTAQSNEFLAAGSPVDIKESLLYREAMMSLSTLDTRLLTGPDERTRERNLGVEAYDFKETARISIPEMYTGRVQNFMKEVKDIYQDKQPKKILDLGGGSGVLAIELVKAFTNCQGVIFESPQVTEIPEKLVRTEGISEKISVLEGDFMEDDFGGAYDLIIAAGILDFTKGNLENLLKRLYDALTKEGMLYVVTHQVDKDYLSPPETILGWLSSHLEGLDILLTEEIIETALHKQGFVRKKESLTGGTLQGIKAKFYGKN
ncbi:O-methyltransferase [Anaerocolumna cellulosilytica]|uniref:O-methyltransferase n=1 Tax=Anaerocolumna cellulosilytica TaxID=433286 RepID=A0A6S6R4A5_9FIRM|nr:methyltransferase [Anaerocolumna cellulosilytica]MBB5194732.1 putative O-methyltransferase YrrM [Anaerocolumna cellulosilytica]BCJ94305.1 O-methyltransferase [Anaerocolumna cellulosilytica]